MPHRGRTRLGWLPIYIVPQTRLPANLGGLSVCGGYTASRLDLHLRDYIPDHRGRGPCMVINDGHLRATYPEDFDYYFTATVLHELAHLLMQPWLYDERATATPEALRREARRVADMVATETPEDGHPPFEGHGAQFIRVALHLRHRAEMCGTWLAPNDLCAGHRYSLSHARRYQVALADEPERLATMSIAKIITTKPPPEFAQLWADDVHAHFQSLSRFQRSHSMKATALLDKIAGRQQERRQAREADFRRLVVQVADGQEPDAETIEHVLGGNQKTIDDLREAVELLQHRRDLRRTVDNSPNLGEERQRIEKEMAEANRIYNEANAKHDRTVDPLHARLRELRTLVSEAEQARRELWDTCRDEELVERLDKVSRPLTEQSRRLGAMETEARNLRNEAKYEREQAGHAERKPDADAHTEEAARCDTEAKQLERELPALRRQVADLERQGAAIRQQMLVP